MITNELERIQKEGTVTQFISKLDYWVKELRKSRYNLRITSVLSKSRSLHLPNASCRSYVLKRVSRLMRTSYRQADYL